MVSKKGLLLTVCSLGILLSHTMPAYAINIEHLPGYSRMTVGQSFEEYLKKNPALVKALSENRQLSMAVLRNASLQSQLQHGKVQLTDLVNQYAAMKQDDVAIAKHITAANGPAAISSEAKLMVAQAQTAVTNQNAREHAAADIETQATLTTAAMTTSQNDIAAHLALAAIIADNPALAAYFQNNQNAYQQVLNSDVRIEDILAETNTPAVAIAVVDTPPPAPAAAPVVTSYDLTAVPASSTLAADASGWPAYLNVPTGCPAPNANRKYFHEAGTYEYRGGNRPAILPHYGEHGANYIAPLLNGPSHAGSWLRLTDAETYAVPFVTGFDGFINFSGQTNGQDQTSVAFDGLGWDIAISHCPDDFTGVTPAGKISVSLSSNHQVNHRCHAFGYMARVRGMVMPAEHPGRDSRIANCVLEPNTRYFVNIRVRPDLVTNNDFTRTQIEEMNANPSKARSSRVVLGKRRPVYGFLLDGAAHGHPYALYNGPCLSSPPYPLGYFSADCGEVKELGNNPTLSTESSTDVFSCHDPYNTKPSSQYTRRYDAQNKRLIWTTGYRTPFYNQYKCEMAKDGYVAAAGRVCAAHRKGELREQVYSAPSNQQYKRIDQCQFSPENKRYEWSLVAASSLVRHHNQGSSLVATSTYERPLEHAGCSVGGTVHPIGTTVKITCGAGNNTLTETRVCKQREEGLGTFVTTAGYVGDTYALVVASNRCRYTFE